MFLPFSERKSHCATFIYAVYCRVQPCSSVAQVKPSSRRPLTWQADDQSPMRRWTPATLCLPFNRRNGEREIGPLQHVTGPCPDRASHQASCRTPRLGQTLVTPLHPTRLRWPTCHSITPSLAFHLGSRAPDQSHSSRRFCPSQAHATSEQLKIASYSNGRVESRCGGDSSSANLESVCTRITRWKGVRKRYPTSPTRPGRGDSNPDRGCRASQPERDGETRTRQQLQKRTRMQCHSTREWDETR